MGPPFLILGGRRVWDGRRARQTKPRRADPWRLPPHPCGHSFVALQLSFPKGCQLKRPFLPRDAGQPGREATLNAEPKLQAGPPHAVIGRGLRTRGQRLGFLPTCSCSHQSLPSSPPCSLPGTPEVCDPPLGSGRGVQMERASVCPAARPPLTIPDRSLIHFYM